MPTHGYAEVSAHSLDTPSFVSAGFTSRVDEGFHIITAAGDNSYGVLNGTHETYLSHERADFTSGTDDGLHIIAATGDNSYGVLNGTHETYLSRERASSDYL